MSVPQALFLAGDFYHPAEIAHSGVGAALTAAGVEMTPTSDFAGLSAASLVGKHLLVIHRDGVERTGGAGDATAPWMTPAQEEAIEAFVLQGGALLALHNAGWGYPWQGGYRRTLGGYYLWHPPLAHFAVKVLNHDHPVTAGVSDYDIMDEQHWLSPDYTRVTPLLQSTAEDGRGTISGWAYAYGFGRVVYLPHGHTVESLTHPMVQRLLRNAARWLVRG
jgi:hypothetical protein